MEKEIIAFAYFIAGISGAVVFMRGTVCGCGQWHHYFETDRCAFAALSISTTLSFLLAYYHARWAVVGTIPFSDVGAAIFASGHWTFHIAAAISFTAWHRLALRFITPWRNEWKNG